MTRTLGFRRAIVLSAGRGSRLGLLTRDRPKCLLPFAGRALLDWQLDTLEESAVEDIVVIAGFGAEQVARQIEGRRSVRLLHNPFYQVADNLASLWLAREELVGEFLVLNGDTLVSPQIVRTVIESSHAPITVTVDRKASYDDDDMKVRLDGQRVIGIGKTLPPEHSHAESIGLLGFQSWGGALFRKAVEDAMFDQSGLADWYLKVIDRLAPTTEIGIASIEGLPWAELDYPADLESAEAVAQGLSRQLGSWRARGRTARSS